MLVKVMPVSVAGWAVGMMVGPKTGRHSQAERPIAYPSRTDTPDTCTRVADTAAPASPTISINAGAAYANTTAEGAPGGGARSAHERGSAASAGLRGVGHEPALDRGRR